MKPNSRSWLSGSLALVCAIIPARSTIAAQLKEATVTAIIKEVDLLPTGAAARSAVLNDNVRDGTAVKTGPDSRTELTFTDQTLARLGANTIFSFNEGTRNLDLAGGAMLLRVPKGAGGAKISTAAVTAAITGTTVIIEYHPPKKVEPAPQASNSKRRGLHFGLFNLDKKKQNSATQGGYIKFITLEGVARVYLNNRLGESVLVPAGQMLILAPNATRMADPVDVDLERLMKTSLLITDFAPLVSAQLINEEIAKQAEKKENGKLVDTNLVIYGRGTVVSLTDPSPLDPIDQATAAFGLPAPFGLGEFGALTTITSTIPYDIGSGTSIRTAPTITTAGVTDQGKIYRGVAQDGLPSAYFFGSTSSFDGKSGFDASILKPTASFRFADLTISGDPNIIVPKGGALDLALISAGNIQSNPPAATTLTFGGMNSVLFATVQGNIGFGGLVTFADIPQLTFYSRGGASQLFLQSPMQNIGIVNLFSEGRITLFNANWTLTRANATPGDGGIVNAVSNADMLIESSHILATSGVIPAVGAPAGAGGSVSLKSQNAGIALSGSTIQVSSADPPGTPNRRSSASGGTIALESNRPDNVAVQISSSSQLLSLLEAAAPGPGGLITIKATGLQSTMNIGAQMQADRGGIDIRHSGDFGSVTLDGASGHADFVKIAALGQNGVLLIGNTTLDAQNTLKLYAPSTNGMIRFVADCTIGGKVTNIIAAGTVTIDNTVTVTVTGRPVDVYVVFGPGGPQAHYTGFGGDNSTTGTFAGLGATNPQQLSAAPPLGSVGGP
jgi:hypothetical protein